MKIYLLGVGALGSSIAVNLAYDRRDDELVLIDYDKIEPRNYQFGTQEYTREQQGQNKVDALAFNIYKTTGKIVQTIDEKLNPEVVSLPEKGLVVDCLDNYEARLCAKMVSEINGYDCLHVGFSPKLTFSIEWNENYIIPDDIIGSFDICEAQGARSFIKYVSGLATLTIIEFLTTGKKLEFIGNRFSVQRIH